MERRLLRITGTVQGVGFRPHAHRLARRLGVTGAVGNDDHGVWCEVQGPAWVLDDYQDRLAGEAPALARVESVDPRPIPLVEGEHEFRVARSEVGIGAAELTVPADVAPCEACLAEMADPTDRRYGYAFACCTDCGPRHTVIRALPYDRERTSMAEFALCVPCAAEYADPDDRRYHAEATCCPRCGPTLTFRPLTEEQDNPDAGGDPLSKAVALLRDGRILALKGAGGYQLVCRADDEAAVARLRERKSRPHKPFALLAASVEMARPLVELDAVAESAVTGPEAPIVLARRRSGSPVCDGVAPQNRLLGVMLAATPLHVLLAEAAGVPLVCTSGNRSEEPMEIDDRQVRRSLGDIADAVLTHDRRIERRADDSVGHSVAGNFQLLRRARGFAPRPVSLHAGGPTVLAVGAELKNTVCLASGSQAHLSAHLGDLEHPRALEAFEQSVGDLLRLTRSDPDLVAHDMHPEYLSTKFALAGDLAPTLGVQHHHAHLVSCLADNARSGPAIGVTFDGLGWGEDATLWGGEFLVGDATGYTRAAHLRPVPLPGGSAAILEPWRMAVSHLVDTFGADWGDFASLCGSDRQADRVTSLCESGRSVRTSAMGRLFDAVSALCGLVQTVTFEGQAAIGLEQAAHTDGPSRGVDYTVELSSGADGREAAHDPGSDPVRHPTAGDEHRHPVEHAASGVAGVPHKAPDHPLDPAHIDTRPLVAAVVGDLQAGVPVGVVAARFHRWVADVVVETCQRIRDDTGLALVALSGGVFQNRLLVELTLPALSSAGFEVLCHRQVPPNDGGISLGQAVIGRAWLSRQ